MTSAEACEDYPSGDTVSRAGRAPPDAQLARADSVGQSHHDTRPRATRPPSFPRTRESRAEEIGRSAGVWPAGRCGGSGLIDTSRYVQYDRDILPLVASAKGYAAAARRLPCCAGRSSGWDLDEDGLPNFDEAWRRLDPDDVPWTPPAGERVHLPLLLRR